MNHLCLAALVTMACTGAVSAQTTGGSASPSDTFAIGARSVRVPAPEGFTRIGRRLDHILSVQEAAESSLTEIVAMHLPTDQLPKYKANSYRQPDFFTKVSVSRIGRDEDITPAGFFAVRTFIEREFGKITDPRGREVLAEQFYVSKNLSELLRSRTKVKWDQPLNLGVFENSDRVHSTLTLLSLSANNKPYKFLGTVSFVYVNKRLLYVYTYKLDPVEKDFEMIREFTRNWTTAIVEANQELTAKRP